MTTPAPCIAVVPGESRQRTLIRRFLAHLARTAGKHWAALDFPADRITTRQAVHAIAMEESGRTSAIQIVEGTGLGGTDHTARRFVTTFVPIERDASVSIPACHVDMMVAVASLSAGGDWAMFANALRTWCRRHLAAASEGQSAHVITVSSVPLRFHLHKVRCEDDPGRLWIVPAEAQPSFDLAVQEALQRDVARLMSASADRYVLIFERNELPWSAAQLRLEIDASFEFPDLARVREIWMVDTRPREDRESPLFRIVKQHDPP